MDSHNKKGGAALVTAALIATAMLFAGCQQSTGSSGGGSDGGTSTFKVTLEKTVGGNVTVSPALSEDGMVAENTVLTLTAVPLSGYDLEKWELDGVAVNGTALTYTLKVTANAQVKVFFKTNGTPITEHTVTLTAPVHGTVTSVPEIPSNKKLPEGTEIVFTATPNDGYTVDTWTVSPGSFTAGGTAGSATATVKVTADITVGVTFKLSGGGSSPIEGVWKAVSATTVTGGVTQTDNFPVQCEDPDNSGNTGAKRQSYMCFQMGWVYNADEFSGMSVPEKNGLVGEDSSQSYTLSGNTLTMEGTEFTVSYPSAGRLELKTVEASGDSHTLLFEKTTDYTAEQISAAPVTGCAVLILSSDKPAIKVKAYTSDHSSVTVAGCTQTSLADGTETELNATGTKVVLKGKITILECNENRLAALNVRGLRALQSLECTGNQLTELNIRNLSALTALECGGNRLTSLDAQGLSALVELYCGANQLDTLNIQGCTDLQTLLCGTNQLTSLDAQGLTALKELYCPKNQLATLNVQGCTSLQTLHCYTNQLISLDVHNLTALKELSGGGNRLTSLNVQGCTALQELACSTNQLTALNVQGLTLLQKLVCYNNQLTTLSVQGLTALQTLRCNGNKLASLNVKNLSALQELYCNDNQLTTLTVQGCTALKALECNGNGLTSLNVQGCTALYRLYCDRNKLNAQAFTKIFGDLPSVTIGFCVLYTEKAGVSEGNHTDFTAPPALQSAFQNAKTVKKWKMYKYDTAGKSVEM